MKKFILFLFLLFQANFIANAATPPAPQPSPELANFFDQWLKKDPQTINEALDVLPEKYFQNFALMKNSRSIQQASPENPRVFLYGHTGETIISFNNDPKHSGFNRFEIADFDPITKTINFYEVHFKKEVKKKGPESLSADEIYKETTNLRISKPNPFMCMGCHEESLKVGKVEHPLVKYIWDDYNNWPGAYGEKDDRLQNVYPPPQDEEAQFLKFKTTAQADKNSRYHHLIFKGSHAQGPYLNPNGKRELLFMPNSLFGTLMAINYGRAVSALILDKVDHQQVKTWLCERTSKPYEYSESLRMMSNFKLWNIGISSVITNSSSLDEYINGHFIYKLWNLDQSWVQHQVYNSFYNLPLEQEKFLIETGLMFLGKENNDFHAENYQRFRLQICKQ